MVLSLSLLFGCLLVLLLGPNPDSGSTPCFWFRAMQPAVLRWLAFVLSGPRLVTFKAICFDSDIAVNKYSQCSRGAMVAHLTTIPSRSGSSGFKSQRVLTVLMVATFCFLIDLIVG